MGEDGIGRRQQDNFAPLTSLDWQVHVYGEVAPEIQALCDERKLPLHVFAMASGDGSGGPAAQCRLSRAT